MIVRKLNYSLLMTILISPPCGMEAQNQVERGIGIETKNLNTTVNPGTDFFEYACGGWVKNNPLQPEYARFGTFDELRENNTKQLGTLITGIAQQNNPTGSLAQKIGDLYKIAMDSARQNKEGYRPIAADLEHIGGIKQRKHVVPEMARYYKKGISGYFDIYISADIKKSSENLVQIVQGGLTLGEKEYYLDKDEATIAIREAYKKHIVSMFELCGFQKNEAQKKMEWILNIETRIAQKSLSAVELRNPKNNYHKISYDELLKQYSQIDWKTLFFELGMEGVKEVNVGQPTVIHEVEKIIETETVEAQNAYMQWHLIDAAASYLSDDIRAQQFAFYGKVLSGSEQDRPRWKKSVAVVEGALGEAVGQLYVEKYFSSAAKERMLNLVHNLQEALAQRIKSQEWMSDETKQVALDKLKTFYVKIGYPDKWMDYSTLDIRDDSYWQNIVRISEFQTAKEIELCLNKPVDRDRWYMTPQTVNAYYNPTTNEICFPAGILQPPFFDMNADDAFNYGAIGVVIGHEMTHGFDDQGRRFDKDGNFTDWWTTDDAMRFKQKAQVMIDYFNTINVLPNLKANGELTLGENLADHGGLKVAYQAFKNATQNAEGKTIEGFTPEQRFFLAYSNVWASNIREEEIRKRTKSDPHSLGYWRVNGALPHIDAWYQAFKITDQDKLYIPKEKRVSVW